MRIQQSLLAIGVRPAKKALLLVFQVLSFFQGIFTFYHQGYELAKDFNHYKMALQINIQNVS